MDENDYNEICKAFKQYTDDQITKMEHHLETITEVKISALKEATSLAKAALETRLVAMNEFRGALSDQNKTLYTRQEHELYKEKIEAQLMEFNEWKNRQEGKADQSSVNMALFISLVGLAIGVISFVLGLFGR